MLYRRLLCGFIALFCHWNYSSAMDPKIASQLIVNLANSHNCPCVNVITSSSSLSSIYMATNVSKHLVISLIYFRIMPLENSLKDESNNCACSLNALFGVTNLEKVSFNNGNRDKWLIFADTQVDTEELFADVDVTIASAVALITPKHKNPKTLVIKEVYRAHHSAPITIRLAATLYPNFFNSKSTTILNIWTRRFNLEGFVFKAGSNNDPPSSIFLPNRYDINGKPYFGGFTKDVFKAFMPYTNYKFNVTWYKEPTGSFLDGNWTGLTRRLIRGEIDVILKSFNMSPERLSVADYPGTMLISRYQVYMFTRKPHATVYTLLKPLGFDVWASVCVWVLVMTFSLVSCSQVRKQFQFLDHNENAIGVDIIYFVLQSLSLQAYARIPTVSSLRLIILSAYVTASVLLPSYSASLISSLTQRSYEKPFDTLNGLLEANYNLSVIRESDEYSLFMNTRDPTIKKILETNVVPFTFSGEEPKYYPLFFEAFKKKNKIAVFGDQLAVDHVVHNLHKTDKFWPYRIAKLGKRMPIFHQSFVFRKGCPYTNIFKFRFLQMWEYGILKKLWLKHWPNEAPTPASVINVTMSDVMPIFYGLGISIVMSLLILALEIGYYKKRN